MSFPGIADTNIYKKCVNLTLYSFEIKYYGRIDNSQVFE